MSKKNASNALYNFSMAGAVGIAVLALCLAFWSSGRTSPERARESVLVVDTSIEVQFNPFFFLFNSFRAPRNAIDITSAKTILHVGGAAFLIDGRLITAAHVVTADPGDKIVKITVRSLYGERANVQVLRSSNKEIDLSELVVLSGDLGRLPSLALSSRIPARGDSVSEVGHPGLIHYVVSRGSIVGFDTSQGYNIAALDTFGGNSGGPILNSRGQVIGVCHTILSGSRFTGIGTLEQLHGFLYPESVR